MKRVLPVLCLSFLFCYSNPAQGKNTATPQSTAVSNETRDVSPQLETLRKTIRGTEAQRDEANDRLEKMIDELQIEATLRD